MRKKITLNFILALTLCASMTGCGPAKENTDNNSPDSSIAAQDSSTVAVEEVKEQVPTAEILEADIDSGKVQLGNTVFTLPITLNEILEAGGINKSEYDPEVALIKKDESPKIIIEFDGLEYGLWFRNYNDEMKLLKDCTASTTGLLGMDNESSKNMIFPKGIKPGMSLNEVKNIYGEPTSEIDLTSGYVYEFSNDKTCLDTVVDLNTQIVQEIIYSIQSND